jgi:hypothetical protein
VAAEPDVVIGILEGFFGQSPRGMIYAAKSQ